MNRASGFAVVAAEVRSLARRSAEAAKEIKSLIGASVERVEQGTALVDQAGATMTEVVASISRVTDIIGEISARRASRAPGVNQVGEAVGPDGPDHAAERRAGRGVRRRRRKPEDAGEQLVSAVAVFKLGSHATRKSITKSRKWTRVSPVLCTPPKTGRQQVFLYPVPDSPPPTFFPRTGMKLNHARRHAPGRRLRALLLLLLAVMLRHQHLAHEQRLHAGDRADDDGRAPHEGAPRWRVVSATC